MGLDFAIEFRYLALAHRKMRVQFALDLVEILIDLNTTHLVCRRIPEARSIGFYNTERAHRRHSTAAVDRQNPGEAGL